MGWRGPEPPFYPSCSHTALERCALSEVLPQQLYLTNFKGAGDPTSLVERGVTHVAAVGAEFVEDTSDKLTYWHKDITDDDSEGATMAASLKDGVDFLHAAIGGGGCVVVHCAAGISRSASLVIGYFIVHRRQSLRDAFAAVFKARPCIWPNEGFMDALIALEQEQTGATTITSAEYERWGDYDGPEEGGHAQAARAAWFPASPRFPARHATPQARRNVPGGGDPAARNPRGSSKGGAGLCRSRAADRALLPRAAKAKVQPLLARLVRKRRRRGVWQPRAVSAPLGHQADELVQGRPQVRRHGRVHGGAPRLDDAQLWPR